MPKSKMTMEGESNAAAECVDVPPGKVLGNVLVVVVVEESGTVLKGVLLDVPRVPVVAVATVTSIFIPWLQCPAAPQMK